MWLPKTTPFMRWTRKASAATRPQSFGKRPFSPPGNLQRRTCRNSVWTDISARQVRRWRFHGGENGRFPKDCGRVAADALRVHRIHGVVFGSHIRWEERRVGIAYV